MTSESSEEAKMMHVEKQTWALMKEVMRMTFDGLTQQEIMQMLMIEDQLRTEDGVRLSAVSWWLFWLRP